jgi:hypothetical protein
VFIHVTLGAFDLTRPGYADPHAGYYAFIGIALGTFDLARPACSDPQADYGRSGLGALVTGFLSHMASFITDFYGLFQNDGCEI